MIPTPARLTYSVPAPKLKCPSIPVSDPTRTEVAADALLIQRFNAGDETAFVELVQRSRSRICLSPRPRPAGAHLPTRPLNCGRGLPPRAGASSPPLLPSFVISTVTLPIFPGKRNGDR